MQYLVPGIQQQQSNFIIILVSHLPFLLGWLGQGMQEVAGQPESLAGPRFARTYKRVRIQSRLRRRSRLYHGRMLVKVVGLLLQESPLASSRLAQASDNAWHLARRNQKSRLAGSVYI